MREMTMNNIKRQMFMLVGSKGSGLKQSRKGCWG